MSGTRSAKTGRRPRGGAYRRASTHSARVRRLKWLLPLAAVLVLVGLLGVMALARFIAPGVDVNLIASRVIDGQLVIAEPVLSGFTPDGRPYLVSAQNARQVLGETIVTLDTITADVELEGGRTAALEAVSGRFDPDTNLLHIDEAGTLEISDGTRATFADVEIDVAAGALRTDRTVTISRPGAEIVADRMIVEDGGRRLVFETDVSVVLQPSAIQPPGSPPAAPVQ